MENSNRYNFTVEESFESARLDLVLSLHLEETSRNYIQKLIEGGNVKVNGKTVLKKNVKVTSGQEIEIEIPEARELDIEAEDIPLDIVYEDNDVIVVNKPKGMVVHPAVGNYTGTLVNALMFHEKDNLSSINGVIRPGIVHRIDKDTSGILVVAKNDIAHEGLSAQLKDHSMTRVYTALVHNGFSEDEGTIDKPIGRDPKDRMRYTVTPVNSKNAVTHFRIIERFGQYTLIQCRLETGRTHQIRVHMKSVNHPIVGDPVYGIKDNLGIKGQLLHAGTLGFVHPVSGEYMEFSVPLPEEFSRVLEKLRK
ncbi:MAG: RluA family pseudouridine synthase [Clostridia bacterium]|nr:RluA family pseudouridine synthase [Clostridia bacterium]